MQNTRYRYEDMGAIPTGEQQSAFWISGFSKKFDDQREKFKESTK